MGVLFTAAAVVFGLVCSGCDSHTEPATAGDADAEAIDATQGVVDAMAASQASTGASSPGADADPASLAQAPDLAVAGVELSGAQADALAAFLKGTGASLPDSVQ